MGYRPGIDNIEIESKPLVNLQKLIRSNTGLKVTRVIQTTKKNKVVHEIICTKGAFRLDINPPKIKRNIKYPRLALAAGVHVPKIYFRFRTPKTYFQISEWIIGTRTDNLWDDRETITKLGEELGKLNNVKIPKTDRYLFLTDVQKLNFIINDESSLFLIDLNLHAGGTKVIDLNIAKTLLKGIKSKERSYWFLERYARHRSTDKIIYIVENKLQWAWPRKRKRK